MEDRRKSHFNRQCSGRDYRHRIRTNFHALQALGTDRFCKYCSNIRNLSFLIERSVRAELPDVVYEARPALNPDDRIFGICSLVKLMT